MNKFRSPGSRDNTKLDSWLKDIADSEELGISFSNNPKKWNNFQNKYRAEFDEKIELLAEIRQKKIEHTPVTWIYTPRYGYSKAAV